MKLSLVLAAAASLSFAAPAQAQSHLTVLTIVGTTLCLQPTPGDDGLYHNAQQQICSNDAVQLWGQQFARVGSSARGDKTPGSNIFWLRNSGNGLCLGITGTQSNGLRYTMMNFCNATSDMLWYPFSTSGDRVLWKNQYSGTCLQTALGDYRPGTVIQLAPCRTTELSQHFGFR